MIQHGRSRDKHGDGQKVAPDERPESDQPRWRRDFPLEWKKDEYVSRRELVKFLVLTSAAFAVGQSWVAVKSLVRRRRGAPLSAEPIATVDELAVGGAKMFRYPADSTPRLLIRTGPESFVAYDQQCTHLLCPVVPRFEQRRLHCPCHNGWFDLDSGRPLAGPPRRPLPRVLLEVRDRTVFAVGLEGSDT